ncbi:substrate-binding periplasmic protein [Vibrio tapetis]|uniref:ABC-type amino acid transport signal transduction systems periplasmic component/domain n=1 Tax=Vibrio tapetis subsp. tapetis TaxID=1671868 RepID=A0A2N8ZKU1_9VIBR|nr:transporter substrate-binding domain-containing protein [Vibrio tapetis]SON52525.1 ABC-type amino acid transport signal transduction systems periplasmic component/domain [Vibrio tapetis subsp. tapetis]
MPLIPIVLTPIIAVLLTLVSLPVLALERLTYLTEEYPPYNFLDNGELKGISIDLLLAASTSVGSPIEKGQIRLQPWPRGYRSIQADKDTVLFAMARTPQREDKFKWAGPIGDTRIVVLAKKSARVKITKGQDLKKYSIGVISDDVGHQLVLKAGAGDENIERVTTAIALVKMLDFGRIDLWAYEENVAAWTMSKVGVDKDQFEVVYVLKNLSMYYAFNVNTDDKYISKLQRGLDLIKQKNNADTSEYQKIMQRYLSN